MTYFIPIRPAAHDAWNQLQEVLDEADVPCRDRDEWISADPDERAFAAAHCAGCHAIRQCGDYADAAKEREGVWGGRDRTKPPKQAAPSIPLFDHDTRGKSA